MMENNARKIRNKTQVENCNMIWLGRESSSKYKEEGDKVGMWQAGLLLALVKLKIIICTTMIKKEIFDSNNYLFNNCLNPYFVNFCFVRTNSNFSVEIVVTLPNRSLNARFVNYLKQKQYL